MVTLFLRFFRNYQTVFHSGSLSLHSHQQWMRVSFSPQPLQHLLLFFLLIISILTSVRWCLMVVLICISLITSEAEHLFIYLFTICRSSCESCPFRSSAHFSIELFVWCWVLWVIYIIWILNFVELMFTNIISHLVSFLFVLLSVSFAMQKHVSLIYHSPLYLFLPLLPLSLGSNS